MVVRRELAAWLRRRAVDLVPGAGEDERRAALDVLGLDDCTLGRFAAAEPVVVSLPHASPNVFFPRVAAAWYQRHLQLRDPDAFHLRVVLTHVNVSDLGWRPYAWWFVDPGGHLVRETLFTRNKKRKHTAVAALPPLLSVPSAVSGAERAGAELARVAANRAVSYMLVMAAVERAAGLCLPGRTTYVPLDLVVEFFRDRGRDRDRGTADGAHDPWIDAVFAAAPGRRIGPEGGLVPAGARAEVFVLDNSSNLALLALVRVHGVVGGTKMVGYWNDVAARVAAANRAGSFDAAPPAALPIPDAFRFGPVRPSSTLAGELERAGVAYSQGMALAEHGAFAAAFDPYSAARPAAVR